MIKWYLQRVIIYFEKIENFSIKNKNKNVINLKTFKATVWIIIIRAYLKINVDVTFALKMKMFDVGNIDNSFPANKKQNINIKK